MKDIFIYNKIYPETSQIFQFCHQPVDKLKDNCIFVIDTNALLIPYSTSKESIDRIKEVYAKLISESRFFIPGQVVREFAKNRPEKLKEVFQQLNRKQSAIQELPSIANYPLLESIDEYKEAISIEKKAKSLLKKYRSKINSINEKIKGWNWNDPISLLYKEMFSKEGIIREIEDSPERREKIKEDLEHRYTHGIPPGFKDASKPDQGVGDLLIWLSIIELGKEQKKDLIFVSGDEKTDWWHKSENQPLYPRYELIDEYRRVSSGKSFHILKLSEFLNLMGVSKKIIDEVRSEETEETKPIKHESSNSNLSTTETTTKPSTDNFLYDQDQS